MTSGHMKPVENWLTNLAFLKLYACVWVLAEHVCTSTVPHCLTCIQFYSFATAGSSRCAMIQACTTPCHILAAENNTFLGELQPKWEIDCLVKTLWKDFFA